MQLTDERGSVRLVVNASTGAVAQRLDYDEWGVVTGDTAPGFQPFGFAGGLQDPTTKLVHFGARDYAPNLGRWTTKDPSGMAGGVNLYRYANGDPISYVDNNGRNPILVGVAVGVGVALGFGLSTPSDTTAAPANVLGMGLSLYGFSFLGANMGLACLGGVADAAVPGSQSADEPAGGIPLAHSIANGLVPRGGRLAQVLGSLEKEFAADRPGNAEEAYDVVVRATERISFGAGAREAGANGEVILLNAGNITTTLGVDGSIIVARGSDIVLHLLP